jgi:hypothetical protein
VADEVVAEEPAAKSGLRIGRCEPEAESLTAGSREVE